MKKIKLSVLLAALIVLPMIYFTGCSDKSEVTSPNQMNFDSPQFAVIDYNDLMNGVEDATIDNEMVFSNSLHSYGFINMSSFVQGNISGMMNGGIMSVTGGGNNWMIKFDWVKHLGVILRRLNLTEDQKGKVKDAVTAFHTAMKPLVQQFKDANADIIKTANEARKLIVEDIKAGKLTREEAATKLKKLNDETRDKIKNNSKTVEVKTKMCDAKGKLFVEIEKIFTPDQLGKWKTTISKFPNPC